VPEVGGAAFQAEVLVPEDVLLALDAPRQSEDVGLLEEPPPKCGSFFSLWHEFF
jgi:hypothetical protein